MKIRDDFLSVALVAITLIFTMIFTYPKKAKAFPVQQKVTAIYQIGDSTAYDFRSSHNRICTLIIHKGGSHRPALSCT